MKNIKTILSLAAAGRMERFVEKRHQHHTGES